MPDTKPQLDRSKKLRLYCDCGNRAEVMHASAYICLRCQKLDLYRRHRVSSQNRDPQPLSAEASEA